MLYKYHIAKLHNVDVALAMKNDFDAAPGKDCDVAPAPGKGFDAASALGKHFDATSAMVPILSLCKLFHVNIGYKPGAVILHKGSGSKIMLQSVA
jgi:hypothetical protein